MLIKQVAVALSKVLLVWASYILLMWGVTVFHIPLTEGMKLVSPTIPVVISIGLVVQYIRRQREADVV